MSSKTPSPKLLLGAATDLLQLALRFDQPFDAAAQKYFREQRSLGPRERACWPTRSIRCCAA